MTAMSAKQLAIFASGKVGFRFDGAHKRTVAKPPISGHSDTDQEGYEVSDFHL